MMSATSAATLPKKTKVMSTQSVKFKDGMIVTAGDLETAMQYPLSIFQVLVRAYFGCGVVCGLEIVPDPQTAACKPDKKKGSSLVVVVKGGVALDCHGFPIELCGPVKLDLTPDPCSCEDLPDKICIAIRRGTSEEAPREDCGCPVETDSPRYQCTRSRDHVVIKTFLPDDPPDTICMHPWPNAGGEAVCDPDEPEEGEQEKQTLCECLTTCPDGKCCGEAWVLLGCVSFGVDDCDRPMIRDIDPGLRKYVKPTECLCRAEESMKAEIEDLQEQMKKLIQAQEAAARKRSKPEQNRSKAQRLKSS